jgi:hypothetical protein
MLEPMIDLNARNLSDTTTGLTVAQKTAGTYNLYERLFDWANSETSSNPLLMRTNDYTTDNKYVFIDPASISTFQAVQIMGDGSGNKQYKHIGQLTLYEC